MYCSSVMIVASVQMYEGKERRHDLIKELRTTHALQSPEQKIKKLNAEEIRQKQHQQSKQIHKVRIDLLPMCVCTISVLIYTPKLLKLAVFPNQICF